MHLRFYGALAGLALLSTSCLEEPSQRAAIITTRFGIAVPAGMLFDSTQCVVRLAGSFADTVIRYPADLGSDGKLRWDLIADEGVSVQVHTDVLYDGEIVATQDLAFVSGDESIRVPDAIPAPLLRRADPWRIVPGLDSLTLWAIAAPVDKSDARKIDSLGWDFDRDGRTDLVTRGDTGVTRLSVATGIPKDSALDVWIYERSGRVFTRRGTLARQTIFDTLSTPDGHKYPLRTVGSTQWLGANLNLSTSTALNGQGCYLDQDSLCDRYGRLYSASLARTVCPSGWRLPTLTETQQLIRFAGGSRTAGQALQAKSSTWRSGGGNDLLGFAALPAGARVAYDSWRSDSLGVLTGWWTTVKADSTVLLIVDDRTDSVRVQWTNPYDLFSVRCVRPVED